MKSANSEIIRLRDSPKTIVKTKEARNGWTKNSVKAGDALTVNGSLAKDGTNLANARTVTLADGTKVFAGSSAENQTNQ